MYGRRHKFEVDRPGRCPELQLLWQHHDPKRKLLSLHELWEYQLLQLDFKSFVIPRECTLRELKDPLFRFCGRHGRFWEGHGFKAVP